MLKIKINEKIVEICPGKAAKNKPHCRHCWPKWQEGLGPNPRRAETAGRLGTESQARQNGRKAGDRIPGAPKAQEGWGPNPRRVRMEGRLGIESHARQNGRRAGDRIPGAPLVCKPTHRMLSIASVRTCVPEMLRLLCIYSFLCTDRPTSALLHCAKHGQHHELS